jgi:hypothetical protein
MNVTTSTLGHGLAITDGLLPRDAGVRTTRVGTQAVFESDRLRIGMAADARLTIENKTTRERYDIGPGGLLAIDDGGTALQFWGTTSLLFDDGTKLTLQIPRACEAVPGTTWATIVHGDYGVQISASHDMPLSIDERPEGAAELDAATVDGNMLIENEDGAGFIALGEDGSLRLVDQAHLDATDLVKLQRLARLLERLWRHLFNFSGFLYQTSMWGTLSLRPSLAPPRDDDRPPPPKPWRPILADVAPRETLHVDAAGKAHAVDRWPALRVIVVGYAP